MTAHSPPCDVRGPDYHCDDNGRCDCRLCWLEMYGQKTKHAEHILVKTARCGDRLKELFAEFGVEPKGCDACGGTMSRMNQNTPDWCDEHAAELASEIKENAAKYGWLDALIAVNWRMLGSADGRSVIMAAASSSPIIDGLKRCVLIAVERGRNAANN